MRTVLTVDPAIDISQQPPVARMQVKVERHPVNIPLMTAAQQLTVQPLPAWGVAGAVATRGRLLRDALRMHAGVAGVLDNLALAPKGTISPIYVKLTEGDAELLTWEALCDVNNSFVALDRRWPIGRITDPASTRSRIEPRFDGAARVLAVISAFGVAGQAKEWRYLRDAVQDARNAGLDVQLRVLVGEKALFQTITQEIANGLPWVEVGPVTTRTLLADIKRWQPNIVHFFCHGASEGGKQRLEFGTADDYLDPTATQGSATLAADEVVDLGLDLDNPWLMTLNCCEGARPTDDLTSIAHQVVSTAFPAAIAMLEPVDAQDAHEFTRALYASLFPKLQDTKAALAAAPKAEFEWATVLHEARAAIDKAHNNDSANHKEWVVPALYVRGVDPMRFERPTVAEQPDDTARYVTTGRMVAEWLTSVRGSMAEDKRRVVMDEILAGIPKQYWPDVNGTFGG